MNETKNVNRIDGTHVELMEVVIIGAGIAGLSAFREFSKHGISPLILEKSRGKGGRCATRREGQFIADHGAQFFKIKGPEWSSLFDGHRHHLKAIQIGKHSRYPRYIHPAGISSIARYFDADDEIKYHQKVVSLKYASEKKYYEIKVESGTLYHAKNILLTAPLPQSLELLDSSKFKIVNKVVEEKLRAIQYDRCLALMIELSSPLSLGNFGILKNPNSDFAGIYNQSEKGLDTVEPVLVVHASPGLSLVLWNENAKKAKAVLLQKISSYFNECRIDLKMKDAHLHRWRYSEPTDVFEESYVFLGAAGKELALAGDAFGHSSIEGASESGIASAKAMIAQGI